MTDNIENVQQLLGDLHQIADCETPAIGSLPVRTSNIAQGMSWLWGMTEVDPADLRLARRMFAQCHHPDRASAADRERATGRIAVANQMIDTALGAEME